MKILIESDYHCGHAVGLTPPDWQYHTKHNKHQKYGAIQKEVWNWRARKLRDIGAVELHVINGDLVDGKGERSNGVELITADLDEQCHMAEQAVQLVKAERRVITYGTPYHTAGTGELCEARIAQAVNAKHGAHEWIDVAGTGIVIDCKHHIGSSSIPHGRHTAIARDNLWSQLWHDAGDQPRGQSAILIRSHVHYHCYAGGVGWVGIVTPALQGMGSRYGALCCSGHVQVGLVTIEINRKTGAYTWQAHVARIAAQKAQALTI